MLVGDRPRIFVGYAPMKTVIHRFTRQRLYDLVWSEPMKLLASRFGIYQMSRSQRGAGKRISRYQPADIGRNGRRARELHK
jgi:hypothetical protein